MVRRGIIDELRETGEIGDDISMSITGASDLLKSTRAALKGNFIVAVFIAYLLLVAIFSHWGYPLLVMTTVPIGIGGGLFGLWLMNAIGGNLSLLGLTDIYQPFDVITMLGFPDPDRHGGEQSHPDHRPHHAQHQDQGDGIG